MLRIQVMVGDDSDEYGEKWDTSSEGLGKDRGK